MAASEKLLIIAERSDLDRSSARRRLQSSEAFARRVARWMAEPSVRQAEEVEQFGRDKRRPIARRATLNDLAISFHR